MNHLGKIFSLMVVTIEKIVFESSQQNIPRDLFLTEIKMNQIYKVLTKMI